MAIGKVLSADSLAIAAKSAAHAIVRNQRLLTSIDFLKKKERKKNVKERKNVSHI